MIIIINDDDDDDDDDNILTYDLTMSKSFFEFEQFI